MRLIRQAPVYFFHDRRLVVNWAQRELDIVQNDEQLKLFKEEE